jgi:hypothetical protein
MELTGTPYYSISAALFSRFIGREAGVFIPENIIYKLKSQSGKSFPGFGKLSDGFLFLSDGFVFLSDEFVFLSDGFLFLSDESIRLSDESVKLSDEFVGLSDESVKLSDESIRLSDGTGKSFSKCQNEPKFVLLSNSKPMTKVMESILFTIKLSKIKSKKIKK